MRSRTSGPSGLPLWTQPLRWAAISSAFAYYHLAYRVRSWGQVPRRRGPALIVANHQHEVESSIVVSDVTLRAFSWRYPVFTVSSRRMWEPGFMAERLPWLAPFLRGVNAGPLFTALGLRPIENELHTRPFVSFAHTLAGSHGPLPVALVFRQSALERLPEGVSTIADLTSRTFWAIGRTTVSLTEVLEPYRKEILDGTRAQLDVDIARFEGLVREGATVFLTPEGFYTGDGKMRRLRGILLRLAPLSEIWLAGISYDPFVGRRLSLLYRIAKADPDTPLDKQLKRTRPVVVSALLASWLHARAAPFARDEAIDAVVRALSELPPVLFVDPELRRDPAKSVRSALEGMERLGMLGGGPARFELAATRAHPQFPRTEDMIAYQAAFHAETLEGT